MITDYASAVQYLYDNLPMFQRIGPAAIKKDLINIIRLCEALGHPERKFKSIHVAGTNGKGSTAHMLAAILQSAGYKTGLFTSPHLKAFTERIRVNGREIPREAVVDFVRNIRSLSDSLKPSFFEITAAMAFDHFAREAVDVAVIETGLGGRLDSTNVVHSVISVITGIGHDHKDLLGDTLPQIAFEKAGIIKPHTPVVISERQPEIEAVFISKANEVDAPLYFASDEYSAVQTANGFDIRHRQQWYYKDLRLPLRGVYQEKNLPGVFKTVSVLRNLGYEIPEDKMIAGLERVVELTHLKGRWQILNEKPLMVCDTGHNADGIREVLKQIARQRYNRLHIVWGMVKDKDVAAILGLLPKDAFYYFCEAKIPRAMEASLLAQYAAEAGLTGEVISDVNTACQTAKSRASGDDFIFIGGSTFVVAELEML